MQFHTSNNFLRATFSRVFVCLAALLFLGSLATAQQTSAMISGVVQDGQGAVVPNAKLTLVNKAQGGVLREMNTTAEGTFAITPVPPGVYDVNVEASGFKKFQQQNIEIFAGDHVGLPPIVLEVGSIADAITVEASAVQLQTVSAERSGVLTGRQMLNLALTDRNWVGLLRTMPGAISDPTTNNSLPSINGQRDESNGYAVDGVTVMDTGANNMAQFRVNTDAIAEFKVVANAQQAEFGRSSGASVNLITKGGTRDFHGTGYWFHRHEGMNANSFINNYNGIRRPLYRYNTQGFNIGGPIFIPKVFNTNREKLFFFIAKEWQRQLTPVALQQVLVPTEAQRAGDFSKTVESGGQFVPIKDPTTGLQFPNNQIPAARFNPIGLRILNFYPKPNALGDNNFNYTSQFSSKAPLADLIYRFDYNVTDQWRVSARVLHNTRDGLNYYSALNSDNNLGLSPFYQKNGADSVAVSVTTIITPTLTNEFTFGRSENYLPTTVAADNKYLDVNAKLNVPTLFPTANPEGLIPNMVYGLSNSPSTGFSGRPYANENPTVNITDNVSKVFSKHNFKAGAFIELTHKTQSSGGNNNGRIDFTRDASNPGDTNWAFSNALLGNFRSATQTSIYRVYDVQLDSYEFYAQDNWKVRSNLTVDFGLRVAFIKPGYDTKTALSGFVPATWNNAQTVSLYQRQRNPSNNQINAFNPLTNTYGPAVLIGSIIPGSGNQDNGFVVGSGPNVPLTDDRGAQWGPRVGMAWTPFGAGSKTVVRMGGGVFYEKSRTGVASTLAANPPILRTPQVFYGNLSTYASSANAAVFPVAGTGVSKEAMIPTTYNYNLSIQQALPGKVLLDVGYVGSQSRHQSDSQPINEPAFGSAWLPQNQDPTVTARFDGTTTLPVDFTRPYKGLGNLTMRTWGSSSNYNSLQVSANRRMSSHLQFGVSYTWSKALGTSVGTNSNGYAAHPTNLRNANYGPLVLDRTQILNINYIYDLPSIGKGHFLDNPVGRVALNGWQVSGITSFSSGVPGNISYSIVGVGAQALNRQITGSETQAPRIVFTGNPDLAGDGSLMRFIDTSVLRPAAKGSVGMDSGSNRVRGPGTANWDISIFKKISFSESRYFQLRLEMFNAFNHTQWLDFNRSAQFNAAGTAITNLPNDLGPGVAGSNRFGFGALNNQRSPRIIQIATKFYF